MEMMEPGKALDRMIAEKVMGWKKVYDNSSAVPWRWDQNEGCSRFNGQIVPRYSTDIEDAWKVWERLIELGASPVIDRRGVYAEVSDYEDEIPQEGVSVPHAICLMALKFIAGTAS